MTTVHDHFSGRFTVSKGQEEAALDEAMKDTDELSTTEVDANIRARCLKEADFEAVFGDKGPRDDCGLTFRKSTFDLLWGDTKSLSPLRYENERGNLTGETVGAFAVAKERESGSVGVRAVWHSPHGMREQLRTGKYNTDVAKAYRSQIHGVREITNGLIKEHNADWAEISGDWNIDLRSLWVQAYLRTNFPQYSINFHKPYPTRGTFRGSKEIIDIGMLRGAVEVTRGPAIQDPAKGFDHIRWREWLTTRNVA